jgi:hypothetical protein
VHETTRTSPADRRTRRLGTYRPSPSPALDPNVVTTSLAVRRTRRLGTCRLHRFSRDCVADSQVMPVGLAADRRGSSVGERGQRGKPTRRTVPRLSPAAVVWSITGPDPVTFKCARFARTGDG